MLSFYVENENFDATVDHLLQYGRFDEEMSRQDIEALLRKRLARIYPASFEGNPAEHCECVYQSVFCMPGAATDISPNAYLLNLVCRMRKPGSQSYTQI